ncbi:MAG: hypothetical protein IPN33_19295 [Saprospiraceae bacterium]|nr:hypothetical protein [Saprospiraceae bacterium]
MPHYYCSALVYCRHNLSRPHHRRRHRRPLVEAFLHFQEAGRTITTDGEGRFEAIGLAAGAHTYHFSPKATPPGRKS